MKTYFKSIWQVMFILLAAVLFTTVGYAKSTHGMKGDFTGETKMKAGAEIMISADHLLFASLEKLNLTKDTAIAKGGAMLNEGEKMIIEGKKMMQDQTTRIKGKELMLQGGTRMMEGKDLIMHELKSERLLKDSVVKAEGNELTNSENLMLEGKNLMMDGERSFK